MILIDNVPDLDEVGLLLGQFAHELACLFRGVDLDDRRIAEIKFFARYARDEWTGDRHSRRFRSRVGSFAHLEIPKRSADIDHARDPTADITRKRVVQMRLDPGNFIFVGADAV